MPCINIIVAFAGEPLGEKKGFKKDLHQCEKDIIEPWPWLLPQLCYNKVKNLNMMKDTCFRGWEVPPWIQALGKEIQRTMLLLWGRQIEF